MSTNTVEQKRAHKAQQYFRDLLKCLKDTGQCDWPYQDTVYRVVAGYPFDPATYTNEKADHGYGLKPLYAGHLNALLKQPRKRGYKVVPTNVGQKDSKWIGNGPGTWTPQDKHILGVIIGEVQGPRQIKEFEI